ncbi:uncharacterized protein LOC136093131 [Hydra vulgaris]|uniref:uncharacterized protein LOC136093131 n=1 Tax=Hydra vulgaris TaxID=6087 RepID=UPI0032EA3766
MERSARRKNLLAHFGRLKILLQQGVVIRSENDKESDNYQFNLDKILETRDIMTEATHCRHAVDVIYTDFAKAFDKVPHKRLLHKLKAYGIQGALVDWIAAWLNNRCQRVIINSITSE